VYKKLIDNDIEGLRGLDIKSFDLNVFEPIEELAFIDESISPLIYCAYYGTAQRLLIGKTELAKLLMKHPMIDLDLHTPSNRQTPLIVACMGGNYEFVKLLLDAGAEVNKPNAFNHTPLVTIINRLIEDSAGFENRCICFKVAEVLVNHEADPNWVIDKVKGYTLLHTLCASQLKLKKN
jgi:ankyrin repeat protein